MPTTPPPPPQIRSYMVAGFSSAGTVTSDADSIPKDAWDDTVVVLSPGHIADAARDREALALLCAEGVADASLAKAPCQSPGLLTPDAMHEEVCAAVVDEELVRVAVFEGPRARRRTSVYERVTGFGDRLTDGLEMPQNMQECVQLYPADYQSPVGVLSFCARIPDAAALLSFESDAVLQMCEDALMKVLCPPHIAPPFPPLPLLPRTPPSGPMRCPGDALECLTTAGGAPPCPQPLPPPPGSPSRRSSAWLTGGTPPEQAQPRG